ncbi:MAG: polyribonucleotide nucleotidyltransferase [Chlamydiales bacterium]|nr:polyribonucleotide nucleotidyltransferase [Chlamydiales bacterium]
MNQQNTSLESHSITVSIGGRDIVFETGKIARQANGAVIVRSGETMLLSTACTGPTPPDVDFIPLRVDYVEKFSSAGKTLGGFIKREGKPTERETLVCRLIDRPIRPMFEEGYYTETQLITSVLSYDGINAPEPLAICANSAALVLSDIPLIKPIAGVRVGMIEDRFVINPTVQEQEDSVLDLMLAGTEDAILMIEGYCDFLTEDQVMEAIEEGHQAIKLICQKLSDWQATHGKTKKRDELRLLPTGLLEEVDSIMNAPLQDAIRISEKQVREDSLSAIKETVVEKLLPEGAVDKHKYAPHEVQMAIKKVTSDHMRQMILKENKRCDGRGSEDVRQIWIDMDYLPRTHGSAVFTRGETQTIAVCTLGGESMGQRYEDLNTDGIRRFYLQYNFPPFSVGESGRIGPPGRREVGHGKLAERALQCTIPEKDSFPYTIRLESNITESNGSSSMASVCGGCLALMQAGVPIKRPIAGIAMGLILEKDSYAILSDILGVEDALGDMDFKITGDEKGITAFQLDIKVEGINPQIMKVALAQAKQGRIHILHKMLEACPKSNEHLSQHAPRIETVQVKPSQIGTIIGPGGKQIREIVELSGADIDIDDSGLVSIASSTKEGMDRAKEIIYNLTAEVEIGQTYKGKIVTIKDFGLFVAILSKQGLCHISELSYQRIENIHDHYKEGDSIEVKVLEINNNGQIRLSHKAILEAPEGYVESQRDEQPRRPPPRRDGGSRDGGNRKPQRKPEILKPPPMPVNKD